MTTESKTVPGRPYVIVAAVAFDATGDYALSEAVRVADRSGMNELHLVHVVTDDQLIGEASARDQRLKQVSEELRQRLDTFWVARARKVIAHIRVGAPARAILQTAADVGADLIVVGTHKRGGLERLVLGSVAERVLREALCPVLVTVPRDYESLAKRSSIEPPCPDCVAARSTPGHENYWCKQHAHTRQRPHVYEPGDRARNSLMPVT